MLVRERVVIAPDEGDVILSGGIGFVGKLYGEENGGSFAIGEDHRDHLPRGIREVLRGVG
jgi:hypothetical protein